MLRSVNVLAVDDTPSLLDTIRWVLETDGYSVTTATSYPEALQLMVERIPDVVIADVRLKEFNGLGLLIRARLARPEATLIAVSGFLDEALAGEARRHNIAYLLKPFDGPTLLAAIQLQNDSLRGV